MGKTHKRFAIVTLFFLFMGLSSEGLASEHTKKRIINTVKTYYEICKEENMNAYLNIMYLQGKNAESLAKEAKLIWKAVNTAAYSLSNFSVAINRGGNMAIVRYTVTAQITQENGSPQERFRMKADYIMVLRRTGELWKVDIVQRRDLFLKNLKNLYAFQSARELIKLAKEGARAQQERHDVETQTLVPSKKPGAFINGDFSQGPWGWSYESHGYRSSPGSRATTLGPDSSRGYLRIGVYGGYHTASQEIPLSDLDANLKGRFKIEGWSTFRGQSGGWAAIGVSYYDKKGNLSGSIYFYLNPTSTFENKPGVYWYKLGTGLPAPTDWEDVDVNLKEAAENLLGIDPLNIGKVKITAAVFGTHEDRTFTVADFDDFKIVKQRRAPERYLSEKSDENLVAYWRFDEGKGNTIHDSSGNGNNGIIHGAYWVDGISQTALRFEGSGNYIEVPDSPNLDLTTSFTIEAWIKQEDLDAIDRTVIAKGDPGTGVSNYDIRISRGKVRFLFRNPMTSWKAYSTTNPVIKAKSWTHIAVVHIWGKASVTRIYVNGVEKPGAWIVGDGHEKIVPNRYPLHISGVGRLKGFNGLIDELIIWKKALSDEEIKKHYKKLALLPKTKTLESSNIQSGLMAYFPFDGSDEDATGNGYDGIEYGSIHYVPGIKGKAIVLDGINDYVITNFIPPNVFTISLHYKAYQQKNYNPAIFSTFRYVNGIGYVGIYYSIINNRERVWYDGNGFFESDFIPNQWHHLVVSSDGRYISVYKDGTKIGSFPGTTSHKDVLLIGVSRYFSLNRLDTIRNFHGVIDEVKIYNRALSDEDIKELYYRIQNQYFKGLDR